MLCVQSLSHTIIAIFVHAKPLAILVGHPVEIFITVLIHCEFSSVWLCDNETSSTSRHSERIKLTSNNQKEYPKCFFHSDMTQAIGKINIDIKNVDLVNKFIELELIEGMI